MGKPHRALRVRDMVFQAQTGSQREMKRYLTEDPLTFSEIYLAGRLHHIESTNATLKDTNGCMYS